jgi:hypothetical protein
MQPEKNVLKETLLKQLALLSEASKDAYVEDHIDDLCQLTKAMGIACKSFNEISMFSETSSHLDELMGMMGNRTGCGHRDKPKPFTLHANASGSPDAPNSPEAPDSDDGGYSLFIAKMLKPREQ